MGGTERFQENGIIQIENLVKRYGSFVALDHLNLNVREGEIFGLLGPNGSGKTTVINCMLALLKYDKGSIRIFGQEMAPDHYEVKKQIGIILQNVAVFDELTVYENIDYFCGLMSETRRRERGLWKRLSSLWNWKNFGSLPAKTFRRPVKTPQYRLRHCP